MSAPDTNVEKQEAKHKPSLMGIRGAMIFGALMMIGLAAFAMFRADDFGASAYDEGKSGEEAETSVIVDEVNDGDASAVAEPAD